MALGVSLVPGVAVSFQQPADLQGWKPYTPSRLEWLALELNAESRQEATSESPFMLSFAALEKTDTILIYVRYLPDADRGLINLAVDGARRLVDLKAKHRGWDSWLRTEAKLTLHQ
jgi:hypothetical protein